MNRAALLTVTTALALAGWSHSALAAPIFKWVDAAGTVHYGERPPQGVQAEPVDMPGLTTIQFQSSAPTGERGPGASDPPAAGPAEEAPKSIAQQRREERLKQRQEQQDAQAQLEVKCNAMRQQLAWVEPNPRVIVQDPDGSTRRMDDDERVQLVDEARAFIKQNCE